MNNQNDTIKQPFLLQTLCRVIEVYDDLKHYCLEQTETTNTDEMQTLLNVTIEQCEALIALLKKMEVQIED